MNEQELEEQKIEDALQAIEDRRKKSLTCDACDKESDALYDFEVTVGNIKGTSYLCKECKTTYSGDHPFSDQGAFLKEEYKEIYQLIEDLLALPVDNMKWKILEKLNELNTQ